MLIIQQLHTAKDLLVEWLQLISELSLQRDKLAELALSQNELEWDQELEKAQVLKVSNCLYQIYTPFQMFKQNQSYPYWRLFHTLHFLNTSVFFSFRQGLSKSKLTFRLPKKWKSWRNKFWKGKRKGWVLGIFLHDITWAGFIANVVLTTKWLNCLQQINGQDWLAVGVWLSFVIIVVLLFHTW